MDSAGPSSRSAAAAAAIKTSSGGIEIDSSSTISTINGGSFCGWSSARTINNAAAATAADAAVPEGPLFAPPSSSSISRSISSGGSSGSSSRGGGGGAGETAAPTSSAAAREMPPRATPESTPPPASSSKEEPDRCYYYYYYYHHRYYNGGIRDGNNNEVDVLKSPPSSNQLRLRPTHSARQQQQAGPTDGSMEPLRPPSTWDEEEAGPISSTTAPASPPTPTPRPPPPAAAAATAAATATTGGGGGGGGGTTAGAADITARAGTAAAVATATTAGAGAGDHSSSGQNIGRNFPFFQKYMALKMMAAATPSADGIELLPSAAAAAAAAAAPAESPNPGLERRWLCGRALAALRFARSTANLALVFVAGLSAVLITFWSLFPLCTSCLLRTHALRQDVSTPLNETGWSTLYINQLQVIGTHNSYHRRTNVPAVGVYWNYHYPSLTAQLDAGIRHLELDVHYDLKTGRWFVFHLAVLDSMSSCNCLSVCLEEIKAWSDVHLAHHILFIEIELKVYGDFLRICGDKTPDTDHSAFLTLQKTVLDVFPRSRILTPREVRGDFETLTQAVRATTVTSAEIKNYSKLSFHSASSSPPPPPLHSYHASPSLYGGTGSGTVPGTVPGNIPGTVPRVVPGTAPGGSGGSGGGGGVGDSDSSSGSDTGSSSSSGSGVWNRGDDSGGGGGGEGVGVGGLALGLGPGPGTAAVAGGWPLVDATRGMALFVIDYQSQNLACRTAVRKALPDDETVFFERTPLRELQVTHLAAFGETNPHREDTIEQMVNNGLIVRDRLSGRDWSDRAKAMDESSATGEYENGDGVADNLEPTYFFNTAAQLLVSDSLEPVEAGVGRAARRIRQGRGGDSLSAPLACRSRCSAIVPREECILEGFC